MASNEEKIVQDFISKFGYLADKAKKVRDHRILIEVERGHFPEVFEYAAKAGGCTHLCSLIGVDLPEAIELTYCMEAGNGILLNIRTTVPKTDPTIKTVTPYFLCADAYERELVDLLGLKVQGLVPGNRYPLPDDWPAGQYPLRKEWKVPPE